MNTATLSIYIWGVYVMVIALLLVFIPGKTLALFGHDNPKDHWIRIAGIFLISLGYFYINAAQNEVITFYHASILARLCGFVGFMGLTVFKLCKPKIILFGIIDVLGAMWTFLALIE